MKIFVKSISQKFREIDFTYYMYYFFLFLGNCAMVTLAKIITNQPPFVMGVQPRRLLLLTEEPRVIVRLASSLGITAPQEKDEVCCSNSIDFNWHTASDLSKMWNFKKLYTVVLQVLKVYKSLSNL